MLLLPVLLGAGAGAALQPLCVREHSVDLSRMHLVSGHILPTRSVQALLQ